MLLLYFIIGLVLGAFLGVFIMCLLAYNEDEYKCI
jgi:hypothetical protein